MKISLIASLNGAPIALTYETTAEITIGRELGNTISPMALDGVSRNHAKIYFREGAWFVEDLGSSNGTFHKGVKIEGPARLAVDDRLQFGPFEVCIYKIDAESAPSAAAPAPAAPAPAASAVAASATPQPTVKAVPPLKAAGASPVIRKPVVGGSLKPGLKLPPKPGLASGLKLPPKPTLSSGLKLPPKSGASAKPADGVADLPPVEMTPVE